MAEEAAPKAAETTEAAPEKPAAPAPDPYEDLTPDEIREAKSVEQNWSEMTPRERAQVWKYAVKGFAADSQPPAAPKTEQKAVSDDDDDPVLRRVKAAEQTAAEARAEAAALKREREAEKMQAQQAKERKEFQETLNGVMNDNNITDDAIRSSLRREYIGYLAELPDSKRPRNFENSFKKWIGERISAAEESAPQRGGRQDYINQKLAARDRTRTEVRGGSIPAKSDLEITPHQAKNPIKLAKELKRKYGVA